MTSLIGEHEVTIDSKGRFLLPAGFKKQLSEKDAERFVINRGIEECLVLYPISTWEPLLAKVNAIAESTSKIRTFKRMFLNGANPVEPDSAGRILLPPALRQYASLEKGAVMLGTGDKIEIWEKEKYKKLFDSVSADYMDQLTAEVMGGI